MPLGIRFLLRIKQVVHVPRHEGEGGAVGVLGVGAELGLHPLGAGLTVRPQSDGQEGDVPLGQGAGEVVAPHGVGGGAAGSLDPAAGEIQMPQSAGQALLQNGGQDIPLHGFHHGAALARDGVRRLALVVGARLYDEVGIHQTGEGLGKVQVGHVIGLHDDVVEGHEIQGIPHVLHEVEDEHGNVLFISKG